MKPIIRIQVAPSEKSTFAASVSPIRLVIVFHFARNPGVSLLMESHREISKNHGSTVEQRDASKWQLRSPGRSGPIRKREEIENEGRYQTVFDRRTSVQFEPDWQRHHLQRFRHLHVGWSGTGPGKSLFPLHSHLHRRKCMFPASSYHCCTFPWATDFLYNHNGMLWLDHFGRS